MGVPVTALRSAVFFDRDGVLNRLVLNPATGEYESPWRAELMEMAAGAPEAVAALAGAGYLLFLVSNQPSAAKGKCRLQDLEDAHARLMASLGRAAPSITECYYCYHHPHGVVPALTRPCPCRKPSPHFLLKAAADHGVDLTRSWMIGDQDRDLQAGRRAGCRTVLVETPESAGKRGAETPDLRADDVAAAARAILKETQP